MPIIRSELEQNHLPHVYEIFFELNGRKTVSYIGMSSGENESYVSGSSELNRVISNTIMCYGAKEAELGWHKVILVEYPPGTPKNLIEDDEKRLIVASYEECKRLGPGRCWEILNKSHLGDVWRYSSKSVRLRLQAQRFRESAQAPAVSRFPQQVTYQGSVENSNVLYVNRTASVMEGENRAGTTAESIEANFFQKASLELGPKVVVPIDIMQFPSRKRTAIKMRIFLSVVVALQRCQGRDRQSYLIKASTLKYLLEERNFSPGRMRGILSCLPLIVARCLCAEMSDIKEYRGHFSFQLSCLASALENKKMNVLLEYEYFMKVANEGKQSAAGRRYFAILAANQYFLGTGKGLPCRLAVSIISGMPVPDEKDFARLKESQITCSKALKQSEKSLCRVLGTTFATNYFTKRKLRLLESKFVARHSDFQVVIDNSETTFSDFFALLAD